MPKIINDFKCKVPSNAPLEFCRCGLLLDINGKCSRKNPIKQCNGEVINKRKKYSGYSKFYAKSGGYQNL